MLLFQDDLRRGAEYYGECAVISMDLILLFGLPVSIDEVAGRARVAAHYARLVLEAEARVLAPKRPAAKD